MVKHHYIVLKGSDGGAELHPMKEWLRNNPQHLPEGMDASSNTSHEIRSALKNAGWRLKIQTDRVLIIEPREDGDTPFVSELLEDDSANGEAYEQEIAEEITFGLERDLQRALRANIEQLEEGLRIIDNDQERITDAGRIDITAKDKQGNIVIIELKAGTAPPEAVTQVLAYMGAVAEIDKKPVRGMLIAGAFHRRVIMAARAIPNLQLNSYSFQFSFKAVR